MLINKERKAIKIIISLISGIKDSTKFGVLKIDNVIPIINAEIDQLITLLTTKSCLFKYKLKEK